MSENTIIAVKTRQTLGIDVPTYNKLSKLTTIESILAFGAGTVESINAISGKLATFTSKVESANSLIVTQMNDLEAMTLALEEKEANEPKGFMSGLMSLFTKRKSPEEKLIEIKEKIKVLLGNLSVVVTETNQNFIIMGNVYNDNKAHHLTLEEEISTLESLRRVKSHEKIAIVADIDPMALTEMDMMIATIDNRLDFLKRKNITCIQTGQALQIINFKNIALMNQLTILKDEVVPEWKKHAAMFVVMEQQKDRADLASTLAGKNNQILIKNSEMVRDGANQISNLRASDSFRNDTLITVNNNLHAAIKNIRQNIVDANVEIGNNKTVLETVKQNAVTMHVVPQETPATSAVVNVRNRNK